MLLRSNLQGIALIMVLVFLEIFAIFSLYALQGVIWETRISQHYHASHLLANAAEQALQQAEVQFAQQSPINCQVPITPVSNLVTKELSWWQTLACAGDFPMFQYYYVAEDLGTDSCAYIGQNLSESSNVASYYRITLLVLQKSDPGAKIIMQSSIAEPAANQSNCPGKIHKVEQGRQSLRQYL